MKKQDKKLLFERMNSIGGMPLNETTAPSDSLMNQEFEKENR